MNNFLFLQKLKLITYLSFYRFIIEETQKHSMFNSFVFELAKKNYDDDEDFDEDNFDDDDEDFDEDDFDDDEDYDEDDFDDDIDIEDDEMFYDMDFDTIDDD